MTEPLKEVADIAARQERLRRRIEEQRAAVAAGVGGGPATSAAQVYGKVLVRLWETEEWGDWAEVAPLTSHPAADSPAFDEVDTLCVFFGRGQVFDVDSRVHCYNRSYGGVACWHGQVEDADCDIQGTPARYYNYDPDAQMTTPDPAPENPEEWPCLLDLVISTTDYSAGGTITVSPNDKYGNGDGPADEEFTRSYRILAEVTLTAPGPEPFGRWVINGEAQAEGERSVAIEMMADSTAVGEYV